MHASQEALKNFKDMHYGEIAGCWASLLVTVFAQHWSASWPILPLHFATLLLHFHYLLYIIQSSYIYHNYVYIICCHSGGIIYTCMYAHTHTQRGGICAWSTAWNFWPCIMIIGDHFLYDTFYGLNRYLGSLRFQRGILVAISFS